MFPYMSKAKNDNFLPIENENNNLKILAKQKNLK